jgi:hypothetical protein
MKVLVFVLALGMALCYVQPGAAQADAAPGCGPGKQKLDVATTKKYAPVQPDPGKAVIYVIQDDSHFESHPRPTTRIGVDGTWIGATQSNSFLRAALDPGEHHLCASWQGFVGIGMGPRVAALHFRAEAGKSYYFRVKDKWLREHGEGDIDFASIDSDEGQLLASKAALSRPRSK